MYRLFPCIPIYLFLGIYFFSIKSVQRMCICDYVKIALLLANFVFFGLKKSIRQLLHWVAQKHTDYFVFLFSVFFFINRKWYTFKIKLFCNFLSIILLFVGFLFSGFNYLLKHHLKHSLSFF